MSSAWCSAVSEFTYSFFFRMPDRERMRHEGLSSEWSVAWRFRETSEELHAASIAEHQSRDETAASAFVRHCTGATSGCETKHKSLPIAERNTKGIQDEESCVVRGVLVHCPVLRHQLVTRRYDFQRKL